MLRQNKENETFLYLITTLGLHLAPKNVLFLTLMSLSARRPRLLAARANPRSDYPDSRRRFSLTGGLTLSKRGWLPPHESWTSSGWKPRVRGKQKANQETLSRVDTSDESVDEGLERAWTPSSRWLPPGDRPGETVVAFEIPGQMTRPVQDLFVVPIFSWQQTDWLTGCRGRGNFWNAKYAEKDWLTVWTEETSGVLRMLRKIDWL